MRKVTKLASYTCPHCGEKILPEELLRNYERIDSPEKRQNEDTRDYWPHA